MSCSGWEERVALYAGGDLTVDEAHEVAEHLAGCLECRVLAAELAADRAAIEAVARASEPTATELAAVRACVFERVERRRRAWRGLWWAVAPALAGMLAFAVLAPLGKRVPKPKPPATPVQVALGPHAAPVRTLEPPRPAKRKVLRRRAPKPVPVPETKSEPLVVKFLTDDPNIVIVWLFDKKGD